MSRPAGRAVRPQQQYEETIVAHGHQEQLSLFGPQQQFTRLTEGQVTLPAAQASKQGGIIGGQSFPGILFAARAGRFTGDGQPVSPHQGSPAGAGRPADQFAKFVTDYIGIEVLISKVFAAGASFLFNYLARRFIIFNKK